MEMCDCLQELIKHHNIRVEMMYELSKVLLETYPNVENTDVNDVVCEMMFDTEVSGANICAIANCFDEHGNWFIDEDLYITKNDELDECERDFGLKISDFLS